MPLARGGLARRAPWLITSPYRAGDFVWCAFPEHENPARPGPLHIVYILTASDPGVGSEGRVLAAYTTTRPWSGGAAQPLGVFRFDRQQAAALGQRRAFVLDARRLAYVDMARSWFPHLDRPDRGILGHAPRVTRQSIGQVAEDLLTRHAELVEKRGPLWPGRR